NAKTFSRSDLCFFTIYFNFDRVPLAVAIGIGGPVRKRVLMTEFIGDARERITQRWTTWSGDETTAGLLRECFQRCGSRLTTGSGNIHLRHVDSEDTRAD